MGRALLPQQDTREGEPLAQGLPWRAGGPAPPAAMLRVLILTLLWRGSLSQLPGFTLTVPQSVSVQEGLCVLIPCTFTYSASSNTYSSWPQLYRYWYKDQASVVWNPPVASSESSREVSQETRGRFQLAKNPAHGDCSLQISDARRTDAGKYFFRFKKGTLMYNYLSNSYGTDAKLAISVPELTEEPEIQISPADGLPGTLLAGEPVTVTCTAPGRCSGPPPRVTWTGPFRNTAQDVSTQLANGSWAYSSALSFTPGPGDHGKELVCTISYRPPWGPSTRRTVQLHVVYPPGPPNITGTLTRNGRPGPAPLGTEGDVVSLETQEDDSLSLSCDAGSRPEATLSWARMNRSLSPGQEGTRRLELPNLRIGDAGEYRCWAKNSYGSASRALRVHVQTLERTLQITVSRANRSDPQLFQDSPRLGTRLNSSCQHQGPSISCSCSLRSHPPPQLQWQVDGVSLAGNSSWGALQVHLWAQGDETISTLSWMGSEERGSQIFCLGFNRHGSYAALHFELSVPQRGAEKPSKLLGVGVACGLGVAVGFFLLGLCVIKLWGQDLALPTAEAGEMSNRSQDKHTADDTSLIYINVTTIPMDHKTPAAHWTKGIQDGAAAAQAPLGPGKPDELHYASINFSKLQCKGVEPPEAPDKEYSEVRLK
nr:sialic acid-binding Ig-like lectin 13 isoform X4 [Chelonoidis abingdonii]